MKGQLLVAQLPILLEQRAAQHGFRRQTVPSRLMFDPNCTVAFQDDPRREGVSDDELERRRREWKPPAPRFGRGYGELFVRETTQANEGCDFKFLRAGSPTPEPDIY